MQCVVLMSSFLKGSYFAKQKNDFHLTDLYMHGRPQEGVWGKGAPAPSPGICKIWRHTLLSCEVPSALAIKTSKFSLKQGQKIKRTTFRLRLRHTDQMSILLQCAEKLSTLLVLVDLPPPPLLKNSCGRSCWHGNVVASSWTHHQNEGVRTVRSEINIS